MVLSFQSVRNVTVKISEKRGNVEQQQQKLQGSQIPVPAEDSNKNDKIEFVPTQREKPAGLEVEDFLPVS